MITLYGPAQAPFTEKVRRALAFKGLEFELCEPQSPEDYRRWSPKTGQLPVADFGGEHVPDSTDILLRLDELHPQPPLLSPDPKVAAQQRQLEDWADESFSWHWLRYRRHVAATLEPPTAGDALVGPPPPSQSPGWRRVLAWLRAGGTWERPVTGVLRELGDRLDDLVNFLGGRPFFYAERLSMADLAVYGMLFTMRNDSIPGTARLVADRDALTAFMRRVEDATGGKGAASAAGGS